MTVFDKFLQQKETEKSYYVEYISKNDGYHGEGYYYKSREEAEAAKTRMEQVWGAHLWNVVITEK